jgi:hypothetical protein
VNITLKLDDVCKGQPSEEILLVAMVVLCEDSVEEPQFNMESTLVVNGFGSAESTVSFLAG